MDEADFAQAIRLLHVTRAWIGSPPPAANDPVRQDPLYPMQQPQRQRPMLAAINELLAKYPYEGTPAPSSHCG